MSASALKEQAQQIADATPLVHASLASALVAALKDLTVVETGRTAEIPMKSGGKFSYKYADIADVVKLTRPILADHGIVALTPVHAHGDGLACTVILLHASGDRLDLGPFPFPHGHDAQATGSMVTYHRRYALVAALGMAAGDDDDGAGARARNQPAKPAEPHPDAVALLVELADLGEAGDKVRASLIKSAGVEPAVALEDEGWRTWLRGAIDHRRKTLADALPLEADVTALPLGDEQ